ncbi:MAG: lipopolysaccharide biosynthesis protein [Spirosomataceae bacterium]
MEVKINVFRNLIAGLFGKFGQVGIRLIQVPLLISYLGVEKYGIWMLLSSIPSWLTISNLGFGTVAGNDVAIASGKNDFRRINEIYSSTMLGIILIITILSSGCILIVYTLDWISILKTNSIDIMDIRYILIALCLSVLIGFLPQVENIKYRIENINHRAIWIGNLRPWIDFLFLWIAVQLDKGVIGIAISGLIGVIIYTLAVFFDSRKICSKVKLSTENINVVYLIHIVKKGITFQAFPLGNALQSQGYIILVNYLLGPVSVTLFTTIRTLVRSSNQALELINQAIWPELTFLIGARRKLDAIKLHDKAVKTSIYLSFLMVLILYLFGPQIYKLWLGDSLNVNRDLLIWFLVSIPLTSWWYTSSVVLVSTNNFEEFAIRSILASLSGLILAFIFGFIFGIEGIAVSIMTIDIFLIVFVKKTSKAILQNI